MSIRVAIKDILEGDTSLNNILTGGVYDASDLPQDGLTPSAVPDAFNGVRLLPVAVIRFRETNETELTGYSRRRFFELYFYQHSGRDQIDLAQSRCRSLMHHHKQFVTSAGQYFYTTWVDDSGDTIADELDGAALNRSRFYADYLE